MKLVFRLRSIYVQKKRGLAGAAFRKNLCSGRAQSLAFVPQLGALLGLVTYARHRESYQAGVANLQRAFPGLSERAARRIMCRSVQSSEMAFLETLRAQSVSPQELRDYAEIHGLEEFHQERTKGRDVILATAHLGNHGLCGVRLAHEFPFTVTSLNTGESKVEQIWAKIRRGAGIRVLHPTASAAAIVEALSHVEALSQNEVVALFADQTGQKRLNEKKSLVLPFCNFSRRAVTSPARLALLTGAALMPYFAVRRTPWLANGSFDMHLHPDLFTDCKRQGRKAQIDAKTRQLIGALESMVRQHPDQWVTWAWTDMEDATDS